MVRPWTRTNQGLGPPGGAPVQAAGIGGSRGPPAHPRPCKKQGAPDDAGAPRLLLLLSLLASLRRNLSGLGRRVHGRLVRAHIPEQDGAVRQVFLHEAGAARRGRASNNRVDRTHVGGPNPVPAPVEVAVVVVTAMVPEAAVDVPVVPVVVVVPVVMVPVVVMTTAVHMTHHVMMTMAAAAVTATHAATVTAAAVTTGVSTGSDERCQADNGRGNESEECSTFEH